jgi:two-component system chemotaxis response regulator CheV
MANNGILLESGTNEVEILEFVVNGQPFGVNVLKIQAIEQFDPERVTQIQLSHASVVGTLLFRERVVPRRMSLAGKWTNFHQKHSLKVQ